MSQNEGRTHNVGQRMLLMAVVLLLRCSICDVDNKQVPNPQVLKG